MKRTFLLTTLTLLIFAGLAAASMELTSARVYVKQHEYGKALQFYDQALQKEPDNLEAHEERGEVLHTIASDTSLAELAKQIATDKANPQPELYDRMLADFKLAQTPHKSGDDGVIKKLTKKIDTILENTWDHFYFLALKDDSSFADTKDKSKQFAALHDLDLAIKVLPTKWNAYGFKAQILTKMDSTAASAENWKLALKYNTEADKSKLEDKAKLQYTEGAAIARESLLIDYYNLGRSNDVLALADEIMKSDPGNLNAIQLKANTLAKLAGDTTLPAARRDSMKTVAITALQSAASAVKDTASLADIEYTIGQFKLQVADTADALTAFANALKYNPKDKDVLFIMGVLYLEGGSHADLPKARDTFKELTDLDAENGPAWIDYGVALARLGDTKAGADAIKKGKALSGAK